MMERLTEKQSSGYDLKEMNGEWCDKYCKKQRVETCNECVIYQAIQKLAEYEDLEEQGLLLRLPCNVGDTVYVPHRGKIQEMIIQMVSWNGTSFFFSWTLNSGIYPWLDGFGDMNIGKTVFLTKEEAEQKLKEMESGEDNEG